MPKSNTIFKCTNCGKEHPKWVGRCQQCKQFGTIEEVAITATVTATPSSPAASARLSKATTGERPQKISEIKNSETKTRRTPTGIEEFDRVLGGGIVEGAVILLAAAPGTGKSTLLAAASQKIAEKNKTVLYVSGEESKEQIALRHERIGANSDNILILSESNLENIANIINDIKPDLIMVDSIQTMLSGNSDGKIGSPSQVVEVATDFTKTAKRMGIPTILIGHVTKDNTIGGPQTLAHLVDVVLYMEPSSDSPLRTLRADKNRFGSTDEVGLFMHSERGLEEVKDPSGFFTNPHSDDASGYATSIILEGNRAFLAEITALVTPSPLPNPRKISHGLDHARCIMIQAILEKYAGIRLGEKDVYLSTTNGITVKDSSVDLAIAAAILSSYKDTPPEDGSVFFGELTLTGEIRRARFNDRRTTEAERLGFNKIYHDVNVSQIKDLALAFKNKK